MATYMLEQDMPSVGRWPLSSSARVAHFFALMVLNLVWMATVSTLEIDAEHPLTSLTRFLLDALLVIPLLLCRVAGLRMRDLGWSGRHLARDVALGVLGAGAAMAFLLVVLRASGTTFSELWAALLAPSLTERLSYLCIGVAASFYEESTFRGYLQPTLQARWGPTAGLVATAVLFDLAHLIFRVHSLVTKLALGLLFGLLRHRTGSLVAPFVAHALFWLLAGAL